MEIIILIFAVVALGFWVAYLISGNKTKREVIKQKESMIDSLNSHVNSYKEKLYIMDNKFRNIDRELPSNIQAFNSEGEEINYYRIKKMDEDDDFDGYNIGDKVPHIRRKVNYKWKNVPVTLRLRRE
jgi:hypothetical protein